MNQKKHLWKPTSGLWKIKCFQLPQEVHPLLCVCVCVLFFDWTLLLSLRIRRTPLCWGVEQGRWDGGVLFLKSTAICTVSVVGVQVEEQTGGGHSLGVLLCSFPSFTYCFLLPSVTHLQVLSGTFSRESLSCSWAGMTVSNTESTNRILASVPAESRCWKTKCRAGVYCIVSRPGGSVGELQAVL